MIARARTLVQTHLSRPWRQLPDGTATAICLMLALAFWAALLIWALA
jgi:hypothetical protein